MGDNAGYPLYLSMALIDPGELLKGTVCVIGVNSTCLLACMRVGGQIYIYESTCLFLKKYCSGNKLGNLECEYAS